jgi:hypothetical protein
MTLFFGQDLSCEEHLDIRPKDEKLWTHPLEISDRWVIWNCFNRGKISHLRSGTMKGKTMPELPIDTAVRFAREPLLNQISLFRRLVFAYWLYTNASRRHLDFLKVTFCEWKNGHWNGTAFSLKHIPMGCRIIFYTTPRR